MCSHMHTVVVFSVTHHSFQCENTISLRRSTNVRPLNHHCRGQSSSSSALRTGQALLAYSQCQRVYSGHRKIISGPASAIWRKRTVCALRQDALVCSWWACSTQSIQHLRSFFICPLVQRWVSHRKNQDTSSWDNPPTDENRWVARTVCISENGVQSHVQSYWTETITEPHQVCLLSRQWLQNR